MVRYPELSTPPSAEQGEVTSVNFDHCFGIERHPAECYACGEHVDLNEPHVQAIAWVRSLPRKEEPNLIRRLYFHDRKCWSDWARSD